MKRTTSAAEVLLPVMRKSGRSIREQIEAIELSSLDRGAVHVDAAQHGMRMGRA